MQCKILQKSFYPSIYISLFLANFALKEEMIELSFR